jgi:hypothetical protein
MIFSVEVKTESEQLTRGDLVYDKRKLLRVEAVHKQHHGKRLVVVKFRIIGKVNLDRQMRTDRA